MLAVAFILTAVGIWFINQNGSCTTNNKKRLVALSFNFAALILFYDIYGLARGLFIFLAAFALVGIVITFLLPLIKPKPNTHESN